MKIPKTDEVLIAHLLQETLDLSVYDEQSKEREETLAAYIYPPIDRESEIKLGNSTFVSELRKKQIPFYTATYIQTLGCFRVQLFDLTLDFPRDWSFLAQCYDALIYNKANLYFHFYLGHDEENFLRLFYHQFPHCQDIVFFIEDHNLHLAFFDSQHRAFFTDFLARLEFKREIQERVFKFGS